MGQAANHREETFLALKASVRTWIILIPTTSLALALACKLVGEKKKYLVRDDATYFGIFYIYFGSCLQLVDDYMHIEKPTL